MRDGGVEERRTREKKGEKPVPFRRAATNGARGTLNATARIPQQFAKITAVICRRLCSYRFLVLVCPHIHAYIDAHVHLHASVARTCRERHTEDHAHTYTVKRGIIASEHARSNFRSAFLALSLSVPSSLHSPSPLSHFLRVHPISTVPNPLKCIRRCARSSQSVVFALNCF